MTAAHKIAGVEYSADIEDRITLTELKEKIKLYHSFVDNKKITLRQKISDDHLEELVKTGNLYEKEPDEEGRCLAERLLEDITQYENKTGNRIKYNDLAKYGWHKTRLEWEAAVAGAEIYADRLAEKEIDMNDFQIYCKWLERNKEKHGILTKSEYNVLTERIRRGDYTARKELADHYLRMVVSVAKKHPASRSLMDLMEMISVGNLAIQKIVDAFNPDKQASFSTYSYKSLWRLYSYKMDEYKRGIRLPNGIIKYLRPLYNFVNFYFANKGEMPSEKAIIEQFPSWINDDKLREKILRGDTLKNLIHAYDISTAPALLSEHNDDGVPAAHIEAFEARERKEKIQKVSDFLLSRVKPRYRNILKLRFGIPPPPRTLAEVGEILHITREAVRQSEKKAKEELKMYRYILGDLLE